MPNAEARRTMPAAEVVEIERSFLREVGSVFWFIVNTFQESMERVQQGAPHSAQPAFSARAYGLVWIRCRWWGWSASFSG
jgi:hypothetical protein